MARAAACQYRPVSEPAETEPTAAGAPPVDDTERVRIAAGLRRARAASCGSGTGSRSSRPPAGSCSCSASGVLVGILGGQVDGDGITGFLNTVLNWGFGVFVLVGLAGLGWYYLAWRRERYLVTTRRVIEAGGVINKWSRDTSLSMITDMLVGHPWIGRILGYGEIDLLTASEAGTNKIRFLPDADGFKKALLDAKYEHEMEVGGGDVDPRSRRRVAPRRRRPGRRRRSRPRRWTPSITPPRRPARPRPDHRRGVRGEEARDPRPPLTPRERRVRAATRPVRLEPYRPRAMPRRPAGRADASSSRPRARPQAGNRRDAADVPPLRSVRASRRA